MAIRHVRKLAALLSAVVLYEWYVLAQRLHEVRMTKSQGGSGTLHEIPSKHTQHPKKTSSAPAVPAKAVAGAGGVPIVALSKPNRAPWAYVAIISNDDFVDGALVLGASLREACETLHANPPKAELVVIAARGRLHRRSVERLARDGGYDHVVLVDSLASLAPHAYWKDTFDKIFMFGLTQYERIVFLDADMIVVRSMDELFVKPYLPNASFVAAIGHHGRFGPLEHSYFQTGMMVFHPSRSVFDDILKEFHAGIPPRGNRYNQGMNGRDGVLLRNVFGERFVELDTKYSRNLNPRLRIPASVLALHLRGKVKPWFDYRRPNDTPDLGKKEFGFPYVQWWSIYESIHFRSDEYRRAANGLPQLEPYGGAHSSVNVTPLSHVWMQRYTSHEYVQPTAKEDERLRRLTDPQVSLVVGKLGQSCDDVCAQQQRRCVASALYSSDMQSCAKLQQLLGCERCEPGVYWRAHPGRDYPAAVSGRHGSVCRYNLLRDERTTPNCEAHNETSTRLCPCAV